MTKIEIIEEVSKSFTLGTRAIKLVPKKKIQYGIYVDYAEGEETLNEICLYNTADNKHCGVGMYLLPEFQLIESFGKDEDVQQLQNNLEEQGYHSLDDVLREDVRGYNVGFWTDIQSLHDTSEYWGKNGLSQQGEEFKKRLIERHKD